MALGELIVRIGADTTGIDTAVDKAATKISAFGEKMMGVGKTMTGLVTAPIVGFGALAVKVASDAGESASKMEAVFGDATGGMNQWLKELQASVPATTTDLQNMSSGIQDLLVPLGMAPAAAQDMTKQIVTLAADLSSFNNIPMDEAMEKIRAGLVGSYEPALSFGVALSATTVEAEALRMGLIKEGEELSANARAQAAFALIQKGTTAAHGDAAKTADGAANSMKFLTRDTKELAVTVGNILLPVVLPMIQNLTSMAKGFQTLSPETQRTIVVVGALAAGIGPLLMGVGAVIKILPVLQAGMVALGGATGIGIVIAAIAALTFAWVKWGDDLKVINGQIDTAMKALWGGIVAAKDGIVGAVDLVRTGFSTAGTAISGVVTAMVSAIHEQLVGRFGGIVENIRGKISAVTGFFQGMWDAVVGHSYVPDMVATIGAEFEKLHGNMVTPSGAMTLAVMQRFDAMATSNKISTQSMVAQIGADWQRLNTIAGEVTASMTQKWNNSAVQYSEAARQKSIETRRLRDEFLELGGSLEKVTVTSRTATAQITENMGMIGSTIEKVSGNVTSILGSIGSKVGGFLNSILGDKVGGGVMGAITNGLAGLIPGGSIVNAVVGPVVGKVAGWAKDKVTGFIGGLFGKKKKAEPPPPAYSTPYVPAPVSFSNDEILEELRAQVNIAQYNAEEQAQINRDLLDSMEGIRAELRRQQEGGY